MQERPGYCFVSSAWFNVLNARAVFAGVTTMNRTFVLQPIHAVERIVTILFANNAIWTTGPAAMSAKKTNLTRATKKKLNKT
jgi:hypothetical protein